MKNLQKYLTKQNLIFTLATYSIYKLVACPILGSLSFMYKQWIRPRYNLIKRYGVNSWALITGSTSGIGEQYAYQLAAIGFNIVLIGRSAEKLDRVTENIKNRCPQVQVKTYQIDLSSTDVNDYKKIADTFSDLDISILINNAGVVKIQKVGEDGIQNMEQMIKTNMGPYCYLTHFFMKNLSNRGNGKRSAIIFVSSSGADLVIPYISTYVATKLFNDQFAQSLSFQLQGDKIDVLSVKPLDVQSGMNPQKANGSSIITAAECVSGSLDKLGYQRHTRGSWKHQFQFIQMQGLSNFLPGNMFTQILHKMMKNYYKQQKQKKLDQEMQ